MVADAQWLFDVLRGVNISLIGLSGARSPLLFNFRGTWFEDEKMKNDIYTGYKQVIKCKYEKV